MVDCPIVRTLLATTSGSGHVLPVLDAATACRSLGHDPLVVGPEGARAALARGGVAHLLGDDPDPDAAATLWSGFSSLDRDRASQLVEREWFAGMCADALLPAMERAEATVRPGVVLREPCEYASAVVADARGIPRITIGISTAQAEFDVLTSLVADVLDERSPGLARRIVEDPFLTRFPASMDPSPFPTTIRYREVPPPQEGGTSALADALAGSDPVVYVTVGSQAPHQPVGREVLRFMVDALSSLDVQLLVSTAGALGLAELGRGSSNVHVEAWVPQHEALSRSAVVVCHGGSGTTFGALAAGVPLVIVPLFADQPTNARLVEAAGAGIALTSGTSSAKANGVLDDEDAARLRAAVRAMLDDRSHALAARRIRDELAALPTTDAAVELAIATAVGT